jgi:penicillin-binding protein 1C
MDYLHSGSPSHAPKMPRDVIAKQIEYVPQLEASRKEWFIGGTETEKIEIVADAKRVPKIRYPGRDSIIAIDPDIPEDRQRVFFQAQAGKGLEWRLDGKVLAAADSNFAWQPTLGEHHLELLNQDGNAIDALIFHVRGAPTLLSASEMKK